MTIKELISICQPFKVVPSDPVNRETGQLHLDSRKVSEGDVYIAMKGTRVDGHEYVPGAAMKGASAVVVDRLTPGLENTVQIVVKDTREVAGHLFQAFAGYPANELTLIGVTGTNGKTTVATLVHQALSQNGINATLIGTVDTIIGDERQESRLTTPGPDELADIMMKSKAKGVTHVVMEVSSHALQQRRTHGLNFKIAAFTNLSHDHLDYHRDAGEYLRAKRYLFDKLAEDAHAVINSDDAAARDMIGFTQAQVTFTGFKNKDAEVVRIDSSGTAIRWKGVELESPLVGRFNASNLLITASILNKLGYTPDEIAGFIPHCHGAEGRLEQVGSGNPVVLVDYAHTPDALENVLQAVAAVKEEIEKLSVVFGCGGDRDATKRPQMARLAEKYADYIYVTSDNPRTEDPEAIIDDILKGFSETAVYKQEPDRRKAIEIAVREAPDSGIVLIAGKGHETYQEVHGKRHHLDDRTEAEKALAARSQPKGKEVG